MFDGKTAQKSQQRSACGNTHLPKQKMKATLLIKPEGETKKKKSKDRVEKPARGQHGKQRAALCKQLFHSRNGRAG